MRYSALLVMPLTYTKHVLESYRAVLVLHLILPLTPLTSHPPLSHVLCVCVYRCRGYQAV